MSATRSPLTAAERAARERVRVRTSRALRHPARVTNPRAMADALADAFDGRPTVGTARGTARPGTRAAVDVWPAVKAKADADTRAALEERANPRPAPKPRRRRVVRGEPRAQAYARAVLDGECGRVEAAVPGTRNNVASAAAFRVGRVVAALNAADAFDRLLDAALVCGLPASEARAVVRSGLRAGAMRPREAV